MKTKLIIILALALIPWCHVEADSLTNGLVLYYPFDGNVNDASGNGNNGTLVGNPVFVQNEQGQNNSALQFNGQGQYVSFPDSVFGPDISAFTFYARVSVNPSLNPDAVIIQKGSQNGEAQLVLRNGMFEFQVNLEGAGWQPTFSSPITSGYYDIAATYMQGNQIALYVNGQLEDTLSVPLLNLHASWGFYSAIAAYVHSAGSFEYLTGTVDEVRIYDRALTPSEIQALDVPEPSCVAMGSLAGLLLISMRLKRK